jgi:NAD(P)H-flavin reductase
VTAPALHSYLPHPARLRAIVQESADTRTFVLELEPPVAAFDEARPGQFAMLSLLGHGEAAFTLSQLPRAGALRGRVVLTIRRVGTLTSALFALPLGTLLGVRGPFGRGFPASAAVPALYVAGGCGLAPLRAAIECHLTEQPATPLALVYGTRDAASRILRLDLARWERTPGVRLFECVEEASPGWTGRVGTVLDCLDAAVAAVGARRAAVCGPPLMLAEVVARLVRRLDPAAVHVATERYMKCGTGECGHCYVDDRYVCTDGPVFSAAELLRLADAFLLTPPAGLPTA